MIASATWHGRRGPVILGPTEHRVARWLADRTRAGRITIRTVDLAAGTRTSRSEAYRITARLRVLGLFGIENDRAGTKGGRRYWRTAIIHDAGELDARRHREAWARVVAWARAARTRSAAWFSARRPITRSDAPAAFGPETGRGPGHPSPRATVLAPDEVRPPPLVGRTFAEQMRAAGLGRLMDQWRVS